MLTGAYGMVFTLGQAAKRVGVSKPTLAKHIKNGRLSAKKLETGAYAIDEAELGRFMSSYTKPEPTGGGSDDQDKTEEPAFDQVETAVLRVQLENLRERLAEAVKREEAAEERAAEALRREREASDRVTRLIEDQRPKGLWSKFLGGQ